MKTKYKVTITAIIIFALVCILLVSATSYINKNLNVGGNTTLSGNLQIGTDARSLFSYFSSAGDIASAGALLLQDAFFSFPSAYGTNMALMEFSDTIEIASNGANATLTAATQTICDTTEPFELDDEDKYLTVLSSNPSYQFATGEIETYINSSCVTISFGSGGSATIVDAVNMSFIVYPHPTFSVLDNGFISIEVGENKDAVYEIHIPNGTGPTGVLIDHTTGTDQSKALTITQDFDNNDGIVNTNLFSESSTGGNDLVYEQLVLEIRETGITNSSLTFIEGDVIGQGTNNEIDFIHLSGDFNHIVHQGSEDTIVKGYVNSRDETTNFTTAGAGATLFANDNDYIYVGALVNFTFMSFSLYTLSSGDIEAEYYYCNDSGDYKVLPNVQDTTLGMRISGGITFPNPTDRGFCNVQANGTAFANTTDYSYIAIKRTRNFIITSPVESLISIGGATTSFLLQDDMMKLNPVTAPPETCSAAFLGGIYTDIDLSLPCFCDGTNWLQMDDFSSVCS